MINNSSSDVELVEYLGCIAAECPRDADQAADLARALAASGSMFAFPEGRTADVASTGGPSSLSTLLCPLFLRVAGLYVPKLGVPGRPAGGIDCLAQMDGYKTALADDELKYAMEQCGYAHFVAAGRYAPLDARVFRLRQQHGLQEVPTLVAASLLSKKLAMGVSTAGLDIRVASHGNFGRTVEEAQLNARMYENAASLLGISGRPVLTDGSVPYQAHIGRSEALAALKAIFDGVVDTWLHEHLELCRRLSAAAAPSESEVIAHATKEELQQVFISNLVAQGSSQGAFLSAVERMRQGHSTKILAERGGLVQLSLEGIRKALMTAQRIDGAGKEFPDPAGVILHRRPGEIVHLGEVLATVRVETSSERDNVVNQLKAAIRVSEVLRGC